MEGIAAGRFLQIFPDWPIIGSPVQVGIFEKGGASSIHVAEDYY